MAKEIINDKRLAHFLELRAADFSHEIPGFARFRVNAHYQRGTVAMAFRVITEKVRPLDQLGLPEIVHPLNLPPSRPGAGDGRHRLRQIDHAGGHD